MKTRVKQTLEAIEDSSEDAVEAYRLAQKRIDEAVSKGVLRKRTAARKKARLAKRVNSSS
jgi:small subunit ribosomal protein S20